MTHDFKPGVFDSVLCAIAPQTGLKRLAARRVLHQFRYDGARSDNKRATAPQNMSPNSFDVQRDRLQLMREAEDMERNFAPAKMLNRKFSSYVTPRSYHAQTGDAALDKEIEEYLMEDAFLNCDVTGRYDFFRMLEFGVMGCNRGGDYGWAFQRPGAHTDMSEEELIQLPFRIQAVEPDRIGGIYQNVVSNDYVSGLNIGEYGQIESFRVFHRSMTTNTYDNPIDVPASDFVHLTDPMRIDQYRGVSILATAIQNLRDLYEMMDFVKGKAKLASALTVFTNSNGAMAGSGAMDAYSTNLFPGDASGLQQDIQFGQINHLASGTDIKFPSSSSPSSEEQWLMTQLLKFVAMSYDLPYSFALDASALGGVSSRLESEMAKATFERFQGIITPHANRMKNAMLIDAVAKGIFPASKLSVIHRGRWGFRPHPQPDLGKEASAAVNLSEHGMLDPMKHWVDNGQDPETVAASMVRWALIKKSAAEKAGIPVEDIFGSGPSKPLSTSESFTESATDAPKKEFLSKSKSNRKNYDFDESKHPRGDDGRFGNGSHASGEKKQKSNLTVSDKEKNNYNDAVKSGDIDEAQSILDEVLRKNGYISHRGKNPENSRDIVQYVDDPTRNLSYGGDQWVIHESDLHEIPDYVYDYCQDYFGDRESVNPEDILESADAWDDRQFVSDLWQEFGERFESEGIVGFKTNDGGVTFPGYGKENGIIPANAVEKNGDGDVVPIEKRFQFGRIQKEFSTRKEYKEADSFINERIQKAKDNVEFGEDWVSDIKEGIADIKEGENPDALQRLRVELDKANAYLVENKAALDKLQERRERRDESKPQKPSEKPEDKAIRAKKRDDRHALTEALKLGGKPDQEAYAIAYKIIESGQFNQSKLPASIKEKYYP